MARQTIKNFDDNMRQVSLCNVLIKSMQQQGLFELKRAYQSQVVIGRCTTAAGAIRDSTVLDPTYIDQRGFFHPGPLG
jgi:hypothetical protein